MFVSACLVGEDAEMQLALSQLDDELARFQFASRRSSGDPWTIHARGLVMMSGE